MGICSECPLDGQQNYYRHSSVKKKRYLIVNKRPINKGSINHHGIGGRERKLILDALEEYGFDENEFNWFNGIRCLYADSTTMPKDRRQIKKTCKEWTSRIVEKTKPEVIIAFGGDAAAQVMGKNIAVKKSRGRLIWSDRQNAWVYVMLDPSMVVNYPQHRATFYADVRNLALLEEHGFDLDKVHTSSVGDYKIVYDLQEIIDAEPEYLAFDIETTRGLYWHDPDNDIATLQFSFEEGKGYCLPWAHPESKLGARGRARVLRQLRQILQNPKINLVGHNLKFDLIFVLSRLGIRARIDQDTLMLYTLLDENCYDKSLSSLIKRCVPSMAGYSDEFDGRVDKGNLAEVPLMEVAMYGVGDTDATFRLFKYLLPKVKKDKKLWAHYRRVSIPVLNAFVGIELRGMVVNQNNLKNFQKELTKWVEAEKLELLSLIPKSILRKHAKIKSGSKYVDGLRFTRAEFIRDILFNHEDGFCFEPVVFTKSTKKLDPEHRVPSVSSKDHLPYFFDKDPFVQRLAHWIQANRMLDTNVKKFNEKYVKDGFIYPTYSLTTAVTGRSSCSDPNAQNFPARGPNAKAYRAMFSAPDDDYVVMGADLSQAELRIAGDMANDKELLHIYNTGGDVHLSTAMDVMGVSSITELYKLGEDLVKLSRFKAKAVNFGFIYGMWYISFIGYAKTQYGIDFTEEEAEMIDYRFFQRYRSLKPWHRKAIEFAKKHGYVRSYTGRIRHLPAINSPDSFIASEAARQAINSPVQETASSLGLMALAWLEQNIDSRYIRLVGFVHDAIYAYVHKKYIVFAAKTIKRAMESIPIEEYFGVRLKLPIVADVGFGVNTGAMHEMDGLELDKAYDLQALWDKEEESGHAVEFDIPKQYFPKSKGRVEVPEHMIVRV